MTISDVAVIIAIILAPIFAVQVQKIIEKLKDNRARKMKIFSTLMSTRATPLSPYHVEALNRIDIEYYKNKDVVDTWKLLHDNFANYPKDPKAKDFETRLSSCAEKSNDLLTDLLYEMSKSLNYKFDKVLLKRGCYIPKGHGDMELEQNIIRSGLVNLLCGHSPLPIKILEATTQEGSQEQKDENKKGKQ